MSSSLSGVEVIPSAKRLIASLRDLGYDFVAAVADLVDNSIEAWATKVTIEIEFEGDDSWVRIADNGRGMTPQHLKEAMRYGSEIEYEADSLGKFGLGLKTASLSQCQHLSVASRTNPDRASIVGYSWDLNHIARVNRWEILPLDRNGLNPGLFQFLKDNTGTVVLWQRLDRILGYELPYGEAARKRLISMCGDLEQHLGMVFHRFLAGQVRRKKLEITINGNPVMPWDPFARGQPRTRALPPITLPLEYEGTSGEVRLEPYVLPHQNSFSSLDEFRRASGPDKWNRQQGFYIYRADRLIQSGGWCRLRAADEHSKLARIALSFSPALDEAFGINVAKMRVQLPATLRDDIEQAISPAIKLAQETYRKGSRPIGTATTRPGGAAGTGSGGVSPGPTPPKPLPPVRRELSFAEVETRLLQVATSDEKAVIRRVFARLNHQSRD